MIRLREIVGHVTIVSTWAVKTTFIPIFVDVKGLLADNDVTSMIFKSRRGFFCSAPENSFKQ
jgi:uncharacterized protein YdgA (DUF945 family)